MILVDTSVWVDFFRGTEPNCDQLDQLLDDDRVALCGPVETELRRGLPTKRERERVLPLLDACHWLEQPPELWSTAGDLGYAMRRRGATVKTLELLIAVYALHHDVPLMSADQDFELIRKAHSALSLWGK